MHQLLAEVQQFYEDLQDHLKKTSKKDVFFNIGDWNVKVGSQEIPGLTRKFGLGLQNEAGQRLTVLPRECIGRKSTNFQQHKRQLYTWTSPDGQFWNQIDCILCSLRWRSSILSAKTRWLRSGCGSDYELPIAKSRLILKKVRETTRPFRYDLNKSLWLHSESDK